MFCERTMMSQAAEDTRSRPSSSVALTFNLILCEISILNLGASYRSKHRSRESFNGVIVSNLDQQSFSGMGFRELGDHSSYIRVPPRFLTVEARIYFCPGNDCFFLTNFRVVYNPRRPAVCGRFGLPEAPLRRFEYIVRSAVDGKEMASPEDVRKVVYLYLTRKGTSTGTTAHHSFLLSWHA